MVGIGELAAGHAEEGRDRTDNHASQDTSADQCGSCESGSRSRGRSVREQEDAGGRRRPDRDDTAQSGRVHEGGPAGSEPSAGQAPRQQVRDHPPMGPHGLPRHGNSAERQRRAHDDQAHRLVQDHGFQRREPEHPEQHGQPEFGPPRPMRPPRMPIARPPTNAPGRLQCSISPLFRARSIGGGSTHDHQDTIGTRLD